MGPIKISPQSTRSEPTSETKKRVSRTYLDFYLGSVKHALIPETHLFFCALACVQKSLEMIPKAKPLFDDIVAQFDTAGCRKLANKIDKEGAKIAYDFGKFTALYIQKKKYACLVLLPRFLFIIPSFLFNRDFRILTTLIQHFIVSYALLLANDYHRFISSPSSHT